MGGLVHVCDSTFATPVIQRPIELGVDLVIQSTTKYYDGHNITVGGAVIAATSDLHERIKHTQNVHGNIMSPQNAFYTLQTSSFPQRELAVRQHKDGLHGGMLWFEVKGGTAAGRALMDSIQRPWSLCENLGAIESICTCPAVMTHANML